VNNRKCVAKVFAFFCIMLFLTGCDNFSSYKVVNCTRKVSMSDNKTSVELKYEIYYDDEYVKRTVSTERIISSDANVLKEYKNSYEKAFEKYEDIDYYDNKITVSSDTVTSKTVIDYTRVDTDQILTIEGDIGNIYTDDGKVKLKTLLDLYKKYGSQCDD